MREAARELLCRAAMRAARTILGVTTIVVLGGASYLVARLREPDPAPSHRGAVTIRPLPEDDARTSPRSAPVLPRTPPLPPPAPAPAEDPAPAEAREPDPRQREQLASAKAIVEGALARRTWGEAESARMKQVFFQLDREQQTELLERLVPAVNRGDLKVDVAGPLF